MPVKTSLRLLTADLHYPDELKVHTAASGPVAALRELYLLVERSDGFSAIGEVGALVSLLGGTTNVVIWAESEATADALEEMLPELGPALGARGLTVGSVRVRRGIPADAAPATGRLMDTLR